MKIQNILAVKIDNLATLNCNHQLEKQYNTVNNEKSTMTLPNYRQSVYFTGLYDPSMKLQREICTGLRAWRGSQHFGPEYFTPTSVAKDLLSYMK